MKGLVKIVAIVSLTIIECFAIAKGIDGVVLSLVVACISGIAGYEIRNNKAIQSYFKTVKKNFKLMADIIKDVFKGG